MKFYGRQKARSGPYADALFSASNTVYHTAPDFATVYAHMPKNLPFAHKFPYRTLKTLSKTVHFPEKKAQ